MIFTGIFKSYPLPISQYEIENREFERALQSRNQERREGRDGDGETRREGDPDERDHGFEKTADAREWTRIERKAMKTYRVAILGCRSRGTAAGRAYHQHPRTEVVGLCDLLPERRETLGEELRVRARYGDLDKMITETEPDIVVIPTGTELHYDLAMRVLEHGVHIDIEKPMCTDLEQADEVLAKAGERGVKIAVHHQGRTGASMAAVQRALRSGLIGEPIHIMASGKGYYGGYGLMNIGTHLLNSTLAIAGHCRAVCAVALTAGRPVEPEDVLQSPGGMGTIMGERITATFEFENNLTATLLQHRFHKVDTRATRIEIHGSEGKIMWRNEAAWHLPSAHFAPDGGFTWKPLTLNPPDSYDPTGPVNEQDYGFANEFVAALDGNREHACSGHEGLHVLEMLMGVFESAAYRRRVELPQRDRRHPLLRWREEAGLGPPPNLPRPYPEWLVREDERIA